MVNRWKYLIDKRQITMSLNIILYNIYYKFNVINTKVVKTDST